MFKSHAHRWLYVAFFLIPQLLLGATTPPELKFDSPPALANLEARLASTSTLTLLEIMDLVGLQAGGPPIHIRLAPEGSPEAKRAPAWVLGYAYGNVGQVVLLPARVPGYPDTTINAVLRHEVAHVLIARAAGRRPIPRWFNEGLALVAARDWSLQDRSRLIFATLRRRHMSLDDLSDQFPAGAGASSRAYALSGAFMRHLIANYGSQAPRAILRQISRGDSFETAFYKSTGYRLANAENKFWRELSWWNKWFPFLTSSFAIWLAITGLALLAFYRRRAKDQELLQQWEEEEMRAAERAFAELPTRPQVH